MHDLVIYAPYSSPRLSYVLDWLFNDKLICHYNLVHDEQDLPKQTPFISYGKHIERGLSIPDAGLLKQEGIQQHDIAIGIWNNIPTLYAKEGCTLPFDIFSAAFFLLSRYEEYYPYTPDQHNRYPATESILYKNGWLQRPILDEWVFAFYQLLKQEFKVKISQAINNFFSPTYDIDIAWSYKHKGWKRTVGGYAKDLLSGNFSAIAERTAVLMGNKIDPYDSFEWLENLHQKKQLEPKFFILCSKRNTSYDKHILPSIPAIQALVKKLKYTALHPSYHCDSNPDLITEERETLAKMTDEFPTEISRQHYIKNKLPDTYRNLVRAGILFDHSMGYADTVGFRAGTGVSFRWYDLEQETAAPIIIEPFCFMDTAARFGMHLNAEQAFELLHNMAKSACACSGIVTTVFHNFSLGTDPGWKGWREGYEQFVKTYA